MAGDYGLPNDWLNDGVKGLLPDKERPIEGTSSFSSTGIHVGIASAEYLFAMKAQAARQESDGDDLRFLAARLKIHTLSEALDLVERFYASRRLGIKTALLLEDILQPPPGQE